jgi:hypothetical protein
MAGAATNIETLPTVPQKILGSGVEILTIGLGFMTIVEAAVALPVHEPL